MKVKIINKSNNPNPFYATEKSAGMDICAFIQDDIILNPMERVLVPTGLYIQLPDGYEAQIRPRSGLALKKGITVLNSPGTLDADYTVEVGIILINLSNEPFTIKSGERIAQMVISTYSTVQWDNVKYLTKTERGDGGFGHTGESIEDVEKPINTFYFLYTTPGPYANTSLEEVVALEWEGSQESLSEYLDVVGYDHCAEYWESYGEDPSTWEEEHGIEWEADYGWTEITEEEYLDYKRAGYSCWNI